MTTLTQGDTAPALTGTVNADLTGAAVVVHVKLPDKTVLSRVATITDAATGAWSIAWNVGDLDLPGSCLVEVEVTYSDQRVQTFALSEAGANVGFRVRPEIA